MKYPFTIHITTSQAQAISAYTEDLSESGVKVSIREALSPGSAVRLKIFIESEPLCCQGKVVWVNQRKGIYMDQINFFDTGLEFVDIASAEKTVIKEHVLVFKKEQERTL